MTTKCILVEQGGKNVNESAKLILKSIRIETSPTKTVYNYGEPFNTAGMRVMGSYYLNEQTFVAESEVQFTYEPTGNLTHNNTKIIIKVVENGKTYTAEQTITVNPIITSISASPPTKRTYKYQEALNTSGMVVTATMSNGSTQTINSGYTVTPGNGTVFYSLGNQTLTVSYSGFSTKVTVNVTKTAGTLAINPTSIVLNNAGLTKTIQVTTNSDGPISYSPSSVAGIAFSWNPTNRVLSLTGDGATNINSFNITFSIGEGTYWTASANYPVATVRTEFWSWNSNTDIGDASWWAGLRTWAMNATASERLACVGMKKKVTLTAPVRGWSAGANISMICIGADIDGIGTLTFQTEACSPNDNCFSSTGIRYSMSNVKEEAEFFANNCSATASIKPVTKLVCELEPDGSQNQAATTELTTKGFILSGCEVGYTAKLNQGTSSSYQEWTKGGANKAYQYFSSNLSRTKDISYADGTINIQNGLKYWYWLRSRHYFNPIFACIVSIDGAPSGQPITQQGGRLAPAFVIG